MSFRAAARFALMALAAGCGSSLTPAQDRTIHRWLLCDECAEGELDSVVALGNAAVEALEKTALKGPPKDREDNIRRQTEAMYDRIQNPSTPRNVYVAHFITNYRATYHSRGMTALSRIHTPEAHQALVRALQRDSVYREDVRRQLGQAVGAAVSITAGDSQSAPVDSFVKADPTIVVKDTTTGQGLSQVRVLFRVDSGTGSVDDSVRFTSANGTATTHWKLGDSDSINVLSAIAAGHTVRFRALGHPIGPHVVFVVQPSTTSVSQPISPPVRVVVHDPWGVTDPSFTTPATVTVLPINLHTVFNLVNGAADLTTLSVPAAGTFTLKIEVAGAPEAFSLPFTVTP